MAFIGVDWGSSSFRAYLIDGEQVLDTVLASDGLKHMGGRSFEDVLAGHVNAWLGQVDGIFLSGMVTSRTGWAESPYVPCPTRCDALIEQAVRREALGTTLWFLPGLCQLSPSADVMRGEELQLYGLEHASGRQLAILPGTHSKWATLDQSIVTGFRTIVTGELYDLLLNGSLAGQIAKGREHDSAAFTTGVRQGFEQTSLVASIFGLRAGVLLGEGQPDAVASQLSGLLIGNEIREAIALFGDIDRPITLLGGNVLCQRYSEALRLLGLEATVANQSTTPLGFMRVAQQACATIT
ncbi:MAG: 2-dehydro-3-deoxygalactonokinase [Hyphomicrobiales bacterium]